MESTNKGKAGVLNAQYSSVYTDENLDSIPEMGNSPFSGMPHIKVTTKGVLNLLRKLNPKKAIGPDLVPTRILRDYADDFASCCRQYSNSR